MPKVKVKALDAFSHGRLNAHMGGIYTMNDVDAKDLEKLGLVALEGDADDDAADDTASGKMEQITSNKMAQKLANKSVDKVEKDPKA